MPQKKSIQVATHSGQGRRMHCAAERNKNTRNANKQEKHPEPARQNNPQTPDAPKSKTTTNHQTPPKSKATPKTKTASGQTHNPALAYARLSQTLWQPMRENTSLANTLPGQVCSPIHAEPHPKAFIKEERPIKASSATRVYHSLR